MGRGKTLGEREGVFRTSSVIKPGQHRQVGLNGLYPGCISLTLNVRAIISEYADDTNISGADNEEDSVGLTDEIIELEQ